MRIPDETESRNNEWIKHLLLELRVLENKNKRLVDNEDLHSDLLSITAQELRTPLQTISGYVEKIMEDARYREFDQLNGGYLSVIQKNTARLQSMIEKITNKAKIENNSPVPTRVVVEFIQVKDLVEEYRYAVVNTADKDHRISMENMANKQNSLSNNAFQSVIIKFRPPQESLMVNIDRLKIYQVITNLPNNSFKISYKKI